MSGLAPIRSLLESWLDDGEPASLAEACKQLKGSNIDMAELLDWMQRYRCDEERKSLAQRQVRAALGLALVAGPVCKK